MQQQKRGEMLQDRFICRLQQEFILVSLARLFLSLQWVIQMTVGWLANETKFISSKLLAEKDCTGISFSFAVKVATSLEGAKK